MYRNYIKILCFISLISASWQSKAQTTVISKNSSWKYLDDGSNQGTGWSATGFNDASWSSGNAVLGYGAIGSATIATTISYGGNASDKHPTTYFRKAFTLTSTAYGDITLNLLVDDGAVVYVNGTQVLADNMPGSWNYNTYASGATGSEDDYANFIVPATSLVVGTNVIAVEVHNANAGSSDLGFDMEVILNPVSTSVYEVNSGDSWDYLDNGNGPTAGWNSDTNWTVPGAWGNGPSLLGYGTIDGRSKATTISTAANPAAYFRTEFTITDTTTVNYLDLDYVRDDGIAIYINGVEVYRDGLAGTITNSTYANQTIGGSDEGAWNNTVIATKGLLHQGKNVIAASVHQVNAGSSDVGFDLRFETLEEVDASILRGPYIQNTTDSSVVVMWRTNVPVGSGVEFGTTHGTYSLSASDGTAKTNHEVTITGLSPDTKYYYHLSTDGTDTVGRYDNSYFFKTAPTPGDREGKVGFWILGDGGQLGTGQTNVHSSFINSSFKDEMDMILMLGDNAYNHGTDAEFSEGLFDTQLDSVIRNTPMYSAVGNHEVRYTSSHSYLTPESTPYYQIYNFPADGEGGGLASGTESYFSWDYGNVHFISINAEEDPDDMDSLTSTMWSWCKNDLQQNTMDWIVVIVHQGPYTHGSHNSDTESEHVNFRENFLPLLERFGVDLTMSGHSHSYERSRFIKGHYGVSSSYNGSLHEVQSGFGRMPGSGSLTNDCAYEKTSIDGEGAIYCTAGSSSKKGSYANDHNANIVNINEYGSVYVEVTDNKLSYWFIEDDGDTTDYLQILKDTDYDSTHVLTDSTVTLSASWPEGPYLWSNGATSRDITVTLGNDSTFYVQNIAGGAPCMIDSFHVDFPSLVRYPQDIDTIGLTYNDIDGNSIIRASDHTPADANGWYYYNHPADPNALLFAVRNSLTSGNTLPIDNVIDYVEIRQASPYSRIKTGTDSFLSIMPIDWNVVPISQPNGNMDIKFYFKPGELAEFTRITDSIAGTNTDLVSTRTWFKASQGSGISFLNSHLSVDSVANSTDLTSLLVSAPNYTTGVGTADGTEWVDRGNGKNFIQFNGLTSFSGGGLSQSLYDPTPVPVTWLAFNASWVGKNAQLIWQTAQEHNSEYFAIERAIEGGEFEEIGKIAGAGNSSSIRTYQFEDANASSTTASTLSYRLRQTDFNGTTSYSEVRSLAIEQIEVVDIYPNPATERLTISLTETLLGQENYVEIYDLDGSQILRKKLNSKQLQTIALPDVAAGQYVVVIRTANKLFTYRLIKE